MIDRHQQLERRIDQYTQSLHEMQRQVASLEQQLLQMLQVQFSRLAADITTTLQLPQHQANLLQGLVADHLHQLTVTAQLQPPRGRTTTAPFIPSTALTPAAGMETPAMANRDPRLANAHHY